MCSDLDETSLSLPIPHDCSDGVLGAYWRRPEAYLDPGVRAAISTFSKLGDVSGALERLRQRPQDRRLAAPYAARC